MDTKKFIDVLLSDPHLVNAREIIAAQNIGTFSIESSLGEVIGQSLGVVLEGAATDIVTVSQEITRDIAVALAEPNSEKQEAKLRELYGQLSGILEVNRLRVVRAQHEAFVGIITVAIRGLLSGIVAASAA